MANDEVFKRGPGRPARGDQPTKPIGVRLQPETIAALREKARREGITRSALVERLVREGLHLGVEKDEGV